MAQTSQYTPILPQFSSIDPLHITQQLQHLLQANRLGLDELLKGQKPLSFKQLMVAKEALDDQLSQFWGPIGHLHAVRETPVLREAYKACQPLLTEFHTEQMQNKAYYEAVQAIAQSPEFTTLNPAAVKWLENELRDFRLAGVHLPAEQQQKLLALQKRLSELNTHFAENILDATHAWSLHITDESELTGLPEEVKAQAAKNAAEQQKTGWVFTLDSALYVSVMKNWARRDYRKLMYEAYVTRASELGPNAGKYDNSVLMEEIVQLRQKIAHILGFKTFAEYSLATKMAKTPDTVLQFLNDLVTRTKPFAAQEMEELRDYAKKTDGIDDLAAWDLTYYTEKLQQHKFAIADEELRVYFPLPKVLNGLFQFLTKIYGITVQEITGIDIWHPDVQCFAVYDRAQTLRGYFYTDLYARPHKRDGAWMDECRGRRYLNDGTLQTPIAFLTCNFNPPVAGKPALLTHDDVQTLFHEFGHVLHHVLTQVDYLAVGGINGVAWDAVEFPSQMLECFCYTEPVLALISSHVDTGQPLPNELRDKLIAAKNFQAGLHMLRQLEFALFDFRLHLTYDINGGPQVQKILDAVRAQVAVTPTPAFNRFQHSFSHIFAGGYAAGYYSYKWAEVLSTDAYARFAEHEVLDPVTGHAFLTEILERGGVPEPMDAFIAFRGRAPSVDALLEYSGLVMS